MAEVTVSSKFQLVIPREAREEIGLKVGEKVIVIVKDGIINLVPKRRLENLRGFLKGMNPGAIRDEGDRV